jgi:hypothetical protein
MTEHIAQMGPMTGEISRIAQNDYVAVIGFIRRPSHRVIATSLQRTSPWVPTTPGRH